MVVAGTAATAGAMAVAGIAATAGTSTVSVGGLGFNTKSSKSNVSSAEIILVRHKAKFL